jgi:hypothetical protein
MYRKDKDNFDVGRIDIFIRDKKFPSEYKFTMQSINGFGVRSRFGNTLASLGDVNNDGFNGK